MSDVSDYSAATAWWYRGQLGTTPTSWSDPDGLVATAGEVFKSILMGWTVAVHVPTDAWGEELRAMLVEAKVPLDNVCIASPPKEGTELCAACSCHVVGSAGHRAWCERGARRIVGSR